MRIIAARSYDRAAGRLFSRSERATAEAELAARPDAWPVIPGTGGARKARAALAGRGKRGGARLIYFFAPRPELLVLLDLYAKNEKEDLSDADRKAIRAAIRDILTAL